MVSGTSVPSSLCNRSALVDVSTLFMAADRCPGLPTASEAGGVRLLMRLPSGHTLPLDGPQTILYKHASKHVCTRPPEPALHAIKCPRTYHHASLLAGYCIHGQHCCWPAVDPTPTRHRRRRFRHRLRHQCRRRRRRRYRRRRRHRRRHRRRGCRRRHHRCGRRAATYPRHPRRPWSRRYLLCRCRCLWRCRRRRRRCLRRRCSPTWSSAQQALARRLRRCYAMQHSMCFYASAEL